MAAAASVLLMPQAGQTPAWDAWDDLITTIIVPVIAPIVFVLLLMDIVMCCATGNTDTRQKKIVALIESLAAIAVVWRLLDFLLTAA